ncbi:hypothetical protein A2567_02785 [Candidatus Azambacteria bacterium RIFOXYD1_FULL_42_11]|uniref:DUF3105 domain-containing protein n=1 Tax=Candidatus Azambacteria bacterium RIFOXYD1_FULL_42_11 TaxID=1797310 RepID=A0A1F5CHB2_9BACT|nr:MAG: hypothetical protein A2567_02785 [Candidatus Azambacteria bacterium RIFOXYD1_FULL_42_11]
MNELSPKEIYEQKKKEKLVSEKKSKQFGKFKKILIWLIAVLVIGGGIYWFTKRSQEKAASIKIYAIEIPDQGRNHINVGATHPDYNSNPPTSGWHYEDWETKGVYKEQQPDEGLIHNLEHGYIWISYYSSASPEVIKQLESFYGLGKKIIIEPRKENDKIIALAAWGWLDKFDPESGDSLNETELKRIQDFIDAYINQGPEPNAP